MNADKAAIKASRDDVNRRISEVESQESIHENALSLHKREVEAQVLKTADFDKRVKDFETSSTERLKALGEKEEEREKAYAARLKELDERHAQDVAIGMKVRMVFFWWIWLTI